MSLFDIETLSGAIWVGVGLIALVALILVLCLLVRSRHNGWREDWSGGKRWKNIPPQYPPGHDRGYY